MDAFQTLALLPLWYVVFLLSLTCHEAAHAFAAWRGGDRTAYLGGQVSLNPLPHVLREPIGTAVVPLLTFLGTGWMMGWASAPYDPEWERRYPRRAGSMALAGPLANLVLAAIGFGALRVGIEAGAWEGAAGSLELDRLVVPAEGAPGLLDGLGRLFSILLVLNLLLFTFNLFPLPPLDGAALASGWIAAVRPFYSALRSTPVASLAGLVVAWVAFPYVFEPVLVRVLRLLYGV